MSDVESSFTVWVVVYNEDSSVVVRDQLTVIPDGDYKAVGDFDFDSAYKLMRKVVDNNNGS